MEYRKYDPMIKKLIIESGNRNLFPDLRIPRTTINYWLTKAKEPITSQKNSSYEVAMRGVKEELYLEKTKSLLMKECMSNTFKNSEFYDYKSKKTRKFIVELIEDYKKLISLREILSTLGLSNSTYYRWRSEILGCEYFNNQKCSVSRPSQLTILEQQTLVRLANASQFRKFSTVSLMYYCKRKNLLNCSLETWYKYLRLYGIDRKNKRFKKIKYRNGLRAKSVDEYWHIDITEIKYADRKKAYLQVVVDNYSRMIVGWQLSKNKRVDLTYKTLLTSFKTSPGFKGSIICDEGSENTGELPVRLLLGRGIRQLIAKKDIRYSNSMIEAVFRQLKQRFILKPVKTYQSLGRLLNKFVDQYNNIIPHTMLLGATPREAYKNEFDREEFIKEFKINKYNAFRARQISFAKCQRCYKKSWSQL